MNSLERAHTSCVMAQRLNNKAAEEIESGDYDKANKTLHQALRMSRVDFRQPQIAHILMLEACITHSENKSYNETDHDDEEEDDDDCSSLLSEDDVVVDDNVIIYQQSLRVPPQYMSKPMGRILPLLIMYNMALANQLKSTKKKETSCVEEKRSLLNRALKLYQLAYQWQNSNSSNHNHNLSHNKSKENYHHYHHDEVVEHQDDNKSLRFNMILVNNIGDIHRTVNNKQKFQRCMQQLSRNMMYYTNNNSNNNNNTTTIMVHHHHNLPTMESLFRRNIQMSGAAGAA